MKVFDLISLNPWDFHQKAITQNKIDVQTLLCNLNARLCFLGLCSCWLRIVFLNTNSQDLRSGTARWWIWQATLTKLCKSDTERERLSFASSYAFQTWPRGTHNCTVYKSTLLNTSSSDVAVSSTELMRCVLCIVGGAFRTGLGKTLC